MDPDENPAINSLWIQYFSTRSVEIRNRLIENYLPLARWAAYRFLRSRKLEWISHDTIFSHGAVGLISAVESFELIHRVPFGAYATERIKGAIIDALRQEDWMSRKDRRIKKEFDEAVERLIARLGRHPVLKELAVELGISVEEATLLEEAVANIPQMVSFSRVTVTYDAFLVSEDIKDQEEIGPLEELLRKEAIIQAAEKIRALLPKFPRIERIILRLYYFEEQELTMREIGGMLSITESRVSQIHDQALGRLKKYLKSG